MKLADIKFTDRFRVRERLDEATVQQYERVLDQLPPVLVYQIGYEYCLVDGFHRCEAFKRQGRTEITTEVKKGTDSEAYEAAIEANTRHGLPLKSKERRRAAKEFLKRFPERSNRWIGEDLGLDHKTVASIRGDLEAGAKIPHLKTHAGRDGKQYSCTCFVCHPTPISEQRTEVSEAPSREVRNETPTIPHYHIQQGDARSLPMLTEGSVHLTVTSPPYNVGVAYGTHDDNLPLEQWQSLLTETWQECYRVTVSGGRLAVVVPDGVGRSPWQPIAPLVQKTLVDAGWALEGQIVWDKATTGNRTTWGSYRLPTAPRLRDRHEVIIIAGKEGRFNLPEEYRKRDTEGSYSPFLEDGDVFLRLTQSVWQITPTQVIGHPAPFPETLAANLIRLYGFPGCMVLDPFAGSGSTGLAARRLGCRAVLVDIDPEYCKLMRRRMENA